MPAGVRSHGEDNNRRKQDSKEHDVISSVFLVSQLNAACSLEQPTRSYMLPFLEAEGENWIHQKMVAAAVPDFIYTKEAEKYTCFDSTLG